MPPQNKTNSNTPTLISNSTCNNIINNNNHHSKHDSSEFVSKIQNELTPVITEQDQLAIDLKKSNFKPTNYLVTKTKSQKLCESKISANYKSIQQDLDHFKISSVLFSTATQKDRETFIIIDTIINFSSVEALLDSGASHCYMSEATFNHINETDQPINVTPVNQIITLADQSTVLCKGAVMINVQINEMIFEIQYFLVPTLSFETILGVNFINQHVIYGPNRQIQFVRAPHNETYNLINKSEVRIPAYHSHSITAKLTHTSNAPILIEPCQHTADEYGLIIASNNIIDASKDEVTIRISNFSARNVTIPENVCLAHMNILDSYKISSIKSISNIKELIE